MSIQENQTKHLKKEYVFIVIIALTAFFLSLQDVCSPISNTINYSDGSIYQYIGHLICRGRMPYIDAFDHKGPVLYLINAVSFVFGNHGVWFLDVLFLVIYAFIAYITAKKYLKSCWACLVVVSLILTISNSYWIGNTPDWYASVAILYCVSLFADYYQNKDLNAKKVFIIGVMVAFCFWQKFTTIGTIGILCLGILIDHFIRTKSITFTVKCIVVGMLGFGVVSMPLLVWLWMRDAIGKMVEDYLLFSTSYGISGVTVGAKIKTVIYFFTDGYIAVSLILAICLFVSKLLINRTAAIEDVSKYYESVGTDISSARVCVCCDYADCD